MSEVCIGPWRVDAAGPDGWRTARRDGVQTTWSARLAEDAAAGARLGRLARRWARLQGLADAAPALVELRAHGDGALLVVERPEGEPVRGPLPLPEALTAVAALARLDRGLRAAGLAFDLRVEDVRLQRLPAGLAGLARVVVAGLERLEDDLGVDPRLGTVAWAEASAALLQLPRTPAGFDLEAAGDRLPPRLLAGLRAGLEGRGRPHELLASALGLPADDEEAARVRRLAATRPLDLVPTDGAGPVLLVEARPGAAGDEQAWLGLELSLDQVVTVSAPLHGAVDARAVAARRAAFERAAQGRRLVHAPALDPRLRRALAPALRRGEPLLLVPARPAPRDVAAPPVAPPPRLTALLEADGVALALEGLTGPALVVRAPRGKATASLLVPEDGEVVGTAAPDGEGKATLRDATPGERYAAFPLVNGAPGAPARASTAESVEVASLAARSRIGAIEVSWSAPPGTTVVVRGGPAPIESPVDGELLAWTRQRTSLVQELLDAGQVVHYRAFALGARGTLSPGVAARGVAVGPPPALGPVRAVPGDRRVALAWSWPDSPSYDRVRVVRAPPWPEGSRDVLRTAAPELVDEGAPIGVPLSYALRTALDETPSKRDTTVSAKALAELAAFRALPGGQSVVLELELPPGLPHGAAVELVRNTERVPADAQDGSFVRVAKGATRHVDAPLAPGQVVHYRAVLVLDGQRSQGLVASATPVERAGELSGVEVSGAERAIVVKFTPPADRCDEVRLLAGPHGAPLEPVAYDAAAVKAGAPVNVPAPPGQPWRVRLQPVFQGNADEAVAVERAATAWDAPKELTARSGAGAVTLAWTPPAAPPRAWRLKRTVKAGRADDPGVELAVAPDATTFVDTDVQTRRTYVYALSARWGPEGEGEVETPPLTAEASVHADPAPVDRPEVKSVGGGVVVAWLPPPPKDRVRWDQTCVYVSPRPAAELKARFDEAPTFVADEAAALGLEERESKKKATVRDQVRLAAPKEGTVETVVVASACGQARRVCLVAPAVGLPDQFLHLAPVADASRPTVKWTLPSWLVGGQGVRLASLHLERGLEDLAAVDALEAEERDAMQRPLHAEVDPASGQHADQEALPFLTWLYWLEATLEASGTTFTVQGPRAHVPRCAGGTIVPKAEQVKSFFGKKPQITVAFEVQGGKAAEWPPFKLVRGIQGQAGTKPVFEHKGGAAPAPHTDDVSSLGKGMTLVYKVELLRKRDALGFKTGEASVTIG